MLHCYFLIIKGFHDKKICTRFISTLACTVIGTLHLLFYLLPFNMCWKVIYLTSFFNSFNSFLTLSPQTLYHSSSKRHISLSCLIRKWLSRLIVHLEQRNLSKSGYKNASWNWFCGLVSLSLFVKYSYLSNFSTKYFASNGTAFEFLLANP